MLNAIHEQEAIRKNIVKSPGAITGYVWDVIRNLITLSVVFTVYSNIYDSSTKLIFSGLLLTYLSVLTVGASLGQYNMQMALINTRLQLRTQKALLAKSNDTGIDSEDLEEEEAELKKAGYALEKIQYKFYINAALHSILYIAAIYNIITAY